MSVSVSKVLMAVQMEYVVDQKFVEE